MHFHLVIHTRHSIDFCGVWACGIDDVRCIECLATLQCYSGYHPIARIDLYNLFVKEKLCAVRLGCIG